MYCQPLSAPRPPTHPSAPDDDHVDLAWGPGHVSMGMLLPARPSGKNSFSRAVFQAYLPSPHSKAVRNQGRQIQHDIPEEVFLEALFRGAVRRPGKRSAVLASSLYF